MQNDTYPTDVIIFNTVKYWTLLWISWASLLGSVLIILIALVAKPINSDYRYFVANLCFVDVLSSAIWVTVLILSKTISCSTSLVCIGLALLLYANILGMVTALLPTVISRYVLFCCARETYEQWFTKRKIFLYLLVADVYPILCIVGLFVMKKNGLKAEVTVFTLLFLIMFVASYILIAFCSIRVFLKVRSHFNNSRRRRGSRSSSEYAQDVTEKDVVKATLYQAIVPLVAQLPQFISAVYALFATRIPPPIDYWGYFVALFMVAGPLADVLLTFSAIRAYRAAIEQIFDHVRVFFKSATVSPGSSM